VAGLSTAVAIRSRVAISSCRWLPLAAASFTDFFAGGFRVRVVRVGFPPGTAFNGEPPRCVTAHRLGDWKTGVSA
jgi:hypothetical protein